MRSLRIENGGRMYVDGEFADLSQLDNKGDFLTSILTLDVEIGDNVTCADIVHFFYDARELIQKVLSEEYEVVRALVSASPLQRDYKSIRIYKSFTIEHEITEDNQEFMYMSPEIELVPAEPGESGVRNISGLPIEIDENITLTYNDNVIVKSKTKLSLFDLLTCLFDELPSLIKDGRLLLPK